MGIKCLCRLLDDLDNKGRKVCYKVSLYKNCQRQSCSAINCLSSSINILAGGRPFPPEILAPSDLPLLKAAIFDTLCLVAPQPQETEQEGQHPLTWQRAANFRLLANQWAERRLVTQWRHGCRAMRPSLGNVGASNAGRSLCVQISREWIYPLSIYWYHSKGNWLRYNFAADSFFLYNETLQQTFRPVLSKLFKIRQI